MCGYVKILKQLLRVFAPLLAVLAVKRQTLRSQPFPAHFIKCTGSLSNMPQNILESFTPRVLGKVSC